MSLFRITKKSYGELNLGSKEFKTIVYDVSRHKVVYTTCNGITHILDCDFGSIFDELHSIVRSEKFQAEKPFKDGNDGDWYEFKYTEGGSINKYEGYIYGLEAHQKVVNLICSCASEVLEDERKLLDNNYPSKGAGLMEQWAVDILQKRRELSESFLDFWEDI